MRRGPAYRWTASHLFAHPRGLHILQIELLYPLLPAGGHNVGYDSQAQPNLPRESSR